MKKPKHIERKDLVEAFWECHRSLGHQPTTNEINTYGKFSVRIYHHEYGNWTKFLESVGLKPLSPRAPSREELVADFWECHRKLGRQPSLTEIEKYGKYSMAPYAFRYGSWTKFLQTLGLHPLYSKVIPLKDLHTEYDRLKKQLGRIPTWKDMVEHGRYSIANYERRFGNFNNYQLARKDRLLMRYNVTREDVIADFEIAKKKLGRVPSIQEIKRYGKCESFASSVKFLFGCYSAFLKARKEQSSRESKTEEHRKKVVAEYFRIRKNLRRVPKVREFKILCKYNPGQVITYYGGWKGMRLALDKIPDRGAGSR